MTSEPWAAALGWEGEELTPASKQVTSPRGPRASAVRSSCLRSSREWQGEPQRPSWRKRTVEQRGVGADNGVTGTSRAPGSSGHLLRFCEASGWWVVMFWGTQVLEGRAMLVLSLLY